jgi:hypothetical protein
LWGWIGGGKLVFVHRLSGSSSAVERQLPKLDVAGSIPVSRSISRPRCTACQRPGSKAKYRIADSHFGIFISMRSLRSLNCKRGFT